MLDAIPVGGVHRFPIAEFKTVPNGSFERVQTRIDVNAPQSTVQVDIPPLVMGRIIRDVCQSRPGQQSQNS